MKELLLLLTMWFCHLVDDYYLQGFLASAKQKSWWEKNASDPLYKHDYVIALLEHAFSWTFVVHIPIFFLIYTGGYGQELHQVGYVLSVFILNWLLHALVDHMKANMKLINLVTDQCIHILQVFCMWGFYTAFILFH